MENKLERKQQEMEKIEQSWYWSIYQVKIIEARYTLQHTEAMNSKNSKVGIMKNAHFYSA